MNARFALLSLGIIACACSARRLPPGTPPPEYEPPVIPAWNQESPDAAVSNVSDAGALPVEESAPPLSPDAGVR